MLTSPVLTPLKSTRGFVSPKPIEPSEYFRKEKGPNPFKFQKVREWSEFGLMVCKTLTRILPIYQPSRFMDAGELITELVLPALKENNICAEFEQGKKDRTLIGNADSILYDYSNGFSEPILIGLHQSDVALQYDLIKGFNRLYGKASSCKLEVPGQYQPRPFNTVHLTEEEIRQTEAQAVSSLQHLCHAMMVNNIRYGYISSESSTRFVRIIFKKSHGYELNVSRPINSRENGRALVAMCLEAYFSHSEVLEYPEFEAIPETVENPNVSPLSSYEEGVMGRIKWWTACRINKQRYLVTFTPEENDIELPPSFNVNGGNFLCIKSGTVQANSSSKNSESAIFLVTEQCDHELRRITSMLQYLNTRCVQYVPHCIAYFNVLDFHVLALKPFGSSVTAVDLMDPVIVDQMHATLTELHDQGVMLGKISIESFFIEHISDTSSGFKIKFIGLSEARLFRRVPEIARRSEQHMLEGVINQIIQKSKIKE